MPHFEVSFGLSIGDMNMTAFPNPTQAFPTEAFEGGSNVIMRPIVTEHFWGYEVRSNEHVLTVATLLRAFSCLLAIAAGLGVFGVWLLPQVIFAGGAFVSKAVLSVALTALALVALRSALRGTHVRVQIDTANGELREVVSNTLGKDEVLARYGLDSVEGVEVVSSKSDLGFGQIQIFVAGKGRLPAGDGAISTLGPLVDRIARDCAMERGQAARPAVWSGPLAA